MKIVKSSFFRPRKCEYGNFIMVPDEGWKFSHSFIDHESKLLVACFSLEDESKWDDHGYNGRFISTQQYIIDLNVLRILEFQEWKHYFNYNKIEIISENQKYKLVSHRIHNQKNNSDSINQELYDNLSGTLISSSWSVGFHENIDENLLEKKCRSERELQERIRVHNVKPNLDEFSKNQLEQLKEEDVVIYYYDDFATYKLNFINNEFILFKGNSFPTKLEDWKQLQYHQIKKFLNLDEFWNEFIKDEKWFTTYKIHFGFDHKILVFAKVITEFFNNIRKEQKATFAEYEKISDWQGSVWSDEFKKDEIKQWCTNCFIPVSYYARYPKYICRECASKDVYDKNGNLLDFSNLGMAGGFKIITKNKNGEIIKEDDTQQYCDCFIDNKLFFAQEARFGGIVIQLKDQEK